EFILSFGYKVGDLSHRKEVQRFLASIKGKPEEQALKIGLLKSLKRARYAAQPLGHYGLAKANYLHFTSPIRRYAHLVVHRTLAAGQTADFQSGMKFAFSLRESTPLNVKSTSPSLIRARKDARDGVNRSRGVLD